jgi:hypothetical protein
VCAGGYLTPGLADPRAGWHATALTERRRLARGDGPHRPPAPGLAGGQRILQVPPRRAHRRRVVAVVISQRLPGTRSTSQGRCVRPGVAAAVAAGSASAWALAHAATRRHSPPARPMCICCVRAPAASGATIPRRRRAAGCQRRRAPRSPPLGAAQPPPCPPPPPMAAAPPPPPRAPPASAAAADHPSPPPPPGRASGPAVKTATYRVAVGVKTAGICWQTATTATQQLAVLTHRPR